MTKLRIPVGKTNYNAIRRGNYAYADKTHWLPIFENLYSSYPFIIRPRRFGKSVFLSMIESYYDCAQAEQFEENFRGTYIYDHKTPLQGKYCVLHLDCSGIDSDNLPLRFARRIKSRLDKFLTYYNVTGREAFQQMTFDSPAELMDTFCQKFSPVLQNRVFLLIDEYDQFANDVLSTDPEQFKRITSAKGFLKNFYAVIKANADTFFEKIYLTGVTPISLDSMTSGFSIATNYSTYPDFADAFGFTEDEVRKIIDETIDFESCKQTAGQIFSRLKELYNGYCFSPQTRKTVFHSSMCMEYLRCLCELSREPEGEELLDSSVAVDLSKIHGILSLGNTVFVRDIVSRCLKGQAISYTELSKTINLNQNDRLSNTDILTTLLSMGYLTYDVNTSKALVCPNKTILEQFFGYYFKYLSQFDEVSFDPAVLTGTSTSLAAGNPEPFLRYVEKALQTSVELNGSLHLAEAPIQYFILGAARLLRGFRATAEEEALGTGFTDLVLRPTPESGVRHTYLFELKYLSKTAASEKVVAEKLAEAQRHLGDYSQATPFKEAEGLVKAVVLFVGTELQVIRYV